MKNSGNRFESKGYGRIERGRGNALERVIHDTRKPIYLVMILDTSGSMDGESTVIGETGEAMRIRKIDQLNDGMKRVVKSLKDFVAGNPLYTVYLQIIELNSYGKEVFCEFQPVTRGFEEIKFEANGCTQLGASLNTLKTFISPKYLRDDRPGREGKNYNKAISVLLMSDGWPTDANGFTQSPPVYRGIVDDFKSYLREMDYARNVDLYSIAVGDDACEDMLRYFCDGDEELGESSRFYRVEECESIASALDFMTRATLAHHTTVPIMDDEEEDEDDASTPDGGTEEDIDNGSDTGKSTDPKDDYIEVDYTDADDTPAKDGEEKGKNGTADLPYQVDIIRCRKDKCNMCLKCGCPTDAIRVNSGIVTIDAEKCNGCGLCESECPYDAIHLAESDDTLDGLFDDIE